MISTKAAASGVFADDVRELPVGESGVGEANGTHVALNTLDAGLSWPHGHLDAFSEMAAVLNGVLTTK